MRTKELVIIAGANGSGKTTFARLFQNSFPFDFVNADEIVDVKILRRSIWDTDLEKIGLYRYNSVFVTAAFLNLLNDW